MRTSFSLSTSDSRGASSTFQERTTCCPQARARVAREANYVKGKNCDVCGRFFLHEKIAKYCSFGCRYSVQVKRLKERRELKKKRRVLTELMCTFCQRAFMPKRRHPRQIYETGRYCSTNCRVRAFHARKREKDHSSTQEIIMAG